MNQISDFQNHKLTKKKISMVTCYDSWSAKIISDSQIDCVLVGDSLAMVMHGYNSTLPATIEMMALHTSAVARSLKGKFLVGDMPFLSYRKSLDENMNAIESIMKAGAQSIKLEGAAGNLDLISHVVESGVPVMGHIGLTPQSIHQLSGFKVQGKNPADFDRIFQEAKQLEKAGCFAVVLECVPADLAKSITAELKIPTIGIGAGVDCDGQVLVLQDMLGMQKDFKPKFLRRYLDGFEIVQSALNHFHNDVTNNNFPNQEESY
jgi:3-methyl-2-oxobutanoate hydroxymethyltransferase